MSTLADLAAKALHDDFLPDKYATRVRDSLRDAIAVIYRTARLARGDYVPEPFTIQAGALGVVLHDPGLRLDGIAHVDNGQQLAETSIDEIATRQESIDGRGRPIEYALTGAGLTVEGITVVVWPIPDKPYLLQPTGRFVPSDLGDDTDVIPLPRDYEHLAVAFARSELFAWEGDHAEAGKWLERFNTGLAVLRGDMQARSNRIRRIPGMWDQPAATPRFRHPHGLF